MKKKTRGVLVIISIITIVVTATYFYVNKNKDDNLKTQITKEDSNLQDGEKKELDSNKEVQTENPKINNENKEEKSTNKDVDTSKNNNYKNINTEINNKEKVLKFLDNYYYIKEQVANDPQLSLMFILDFINKNAELKEKLKNEISNLRSKNDKFNFNYEVKEIKDDKEYIVINLKEVLLQKSDKKKTISNKIYKIAAVEGKYVIIDIENDSN